MQAEAANVEALPLAGLPRFRFNGDAQAKAALVRRKIKLIYGGYGSGKSALHALHYLDEAARGDVSQQHGLFTNTISQLVEGVLPVLEEWLIAAGMVIDGKALEYDREPPLKWFRYWDRAKIQVPRPKKYRGYATLPCGIHIVCGSLHNQGHKQFQSVDFRTIRIEEVFNISEQSLSVMIPRCRCGGGARLALEGTEDGVDDIPSSCGHLHDVTLIGNPPLGQHWIFEWLDRREEAAKKYYTDDEPVNHRDWGLLRRGIGKTFIICVPTRDNLRNVGSEYVEELESGFSPDVAKRYIDGELIREAAGRAFTQYSSALNVSPVPYDPDRAVYAWLDFDLAPRAALFAHLLERGEYPDQGPKDDRKTIHIGVFGEFFSEPEMSNRDFILALIRGGRGVGGDCQYPDPRLRGLPANWDGLRSHKGSIIFSGDARGKDKSRHHDELSSDWKMVQDIVQRELRRHVTYDIPKSNEPPAVQIHGLNSLLCSVAGVRAVHLDPITKHAQRDLEVCEWDGSDLRHVGRGYGGGTLWLRTHLVKALMYGSDRLAPMGRTLDRSRKPKVIRTRRFEHPRLQG